MQPLDGLEHPVGRQRRVAAAQQRPPTIIPIDQTVIDSEQDMADTFYDNGLLPTKVDVADYFSDVFNEVTTGQAAGS